MLKYTIPQIKSINYAQTACFEVIYEASLSIQRTTTKRNERAIPNFSSFLLILLDSPL